MQLDQAIGVEIYIVSDSDRSARIDRQFGRSSAEAELG